MTPSTVRLKQLAERLKQYDHSPLVYAVYKSDFQAAANPEAVLRLISRIEKLEAALEASRSDICWLLDRHELPMMLNDTLTTISEALKEET